MNPSLNSWTTIFLLAAGQGLFLAAILLISNSRSKNFNWPIIILISFFSLTLVHYVMYWSGFIKQFPYLRFIPEIGFYLYGPLLLLYLRRILLNKKPRKAFLIHLIPSLWIFILGAIFWIFKSFPFPIDEFPVIGSMLRFPLWPWTLVVHMLIYNISLFLIIKSYERKSNDEIAEIRIRWSGTLSVLFTAFIVAYASYYYLARFSFFKPEWDYMISIVMSLAIYSIGYMAFTQPRIFNGIFLHQVFVPKKYKSSQLTESMVEDIFNEIVEYFKKEEPFLNPELRQAHICEKLNYTTHQVSQVINEKTGSNFNNFIKKHRLIYAENLIKTNPDIDIKTVYYQSGFNNKTTFNSAFKQHYGITPSEFRKNIASSESI